jgi:hypothetical protein
MRNIESAGDRMGNIESAGTGSWDRMGNLNQQGTGSWDRMGNFESAGDKILGQDGKLEPCSRQCPAAERRIWILAGTRTKCRTGYFEPAGREQQGLGAEFIDRHLRRMYYAGSTKLLANSGVSTEKKQNAYLSTPAFSTGVK